MPIGQGNLTLSGAWCLTIARIGAANVRAERAFKTLRVFRTELECVVINRRRA